ncbi:unnamed protein product, partial [Callosobruchus maculatus]
TND